MNRELKTSKIHETFVTGTLAYWRWQNPLIVYCDHITNNNNLDATKESEQFHIPIQGSLYSYDWLSHKLSLSSFTVDLLSGISDDCQRNCSSLGEIVLYKTDASFNYYDNRLSRSVSLDELESMISKLPKSNFSNSQPVNGEEDGINNSDLM